MRRLHASFGILLLLTAGCFPTFDERNAFWTLTETYGTTSGAGGVDTGQAAAEAEAEFRRTMTIVFANNHETAQVDASFAAWVYSSSVHSADQQDALLRGGYVQLTREIELGTAFTLPPGTFVYNGPGLAGATPVRLACPLTDTGQGLSIVDGITLITPDVALLFSQPPVSCDSVAFIFGNASISGDVVTGPVTGSGGFKTLAQVNVYECMPLRPGLFLKLGGGARASNEYFEGGNVLFEFNETPDADGNYAIVTISI
jgi:hypothetical protein